MRDTIKQEGLPYTQVVNEIIKDKAVSLKAIGLFAFMSHKAQMKDVKWNFTIRSMAKQMKDGEDSIRSGLQELRKVGWVVYTKNTDGTGEYFLKASIKPKQDKPDKASDSQNRENPRREVPMKGNPTPINKKDSFSKKDSSNKKNINTEAMLFEIDNFEPDDASINRVKKTEGCESLNANELENLVEDFKDRMTERQSRWTNIQSQFRTYVTNGWVTPKKLKKGTVDGKSSVDKQLLAMKIEQDKQDRQGRLE
tara:strand:- start:327 stop:1085 length:759 start_codon:yes stop_codon:yes gene_type:complete